MSIIQEALQQLVEQGTQRLGDGYVLVNSWSSDGTVHKQWTKDYKEDSPADRHQSTISFWHERGKEPFYQAVHMVRKGYWTNQTAHESPTRIHHKSTHSTLEDAKKALNHAVRDMYPQNESTITELSPEKLSKYVNRATSDFGHQNMGRRNTTGDQQREFAKKEKRRQKGISKAIDRLHPQNENLEEAIKLGTEVVIHAPGKSYHGKVGHIGEIRHGLYKGAPKTYTVDHDDGSIQLDKKNIKLNRTNESTIVELNKDTIYSYSKKADQDIDLESDKLAQGISANDPKKANSASRKLNKRIQGTERAEKRLASECDNSK